VTDAAAHGRRVSIGTITLFMASAISLPTGIVTAAYLTDRFGAEGYGMFAVVVALVAWFELCSTQFFARPTVKLIAESDHWRRDASAIQRAQLTIALAAAGLLLLLAPAIARALGSDAHADALRLLAIDIPIYALAQNHAAILIGRGDYNKRAALVAVRWLARMVLIVAFVGAGWGLTGALLGCIGASLAELIGARLLAPLPLLARAPGLRLTAYVVPITLHTLGFELFKRLDLIAVESVGAAGDAGYYAAAQNLTIVPTLFAMSLSPLLLSALARTMRAGDPDAARALARGALRVIALLLPLAGAAAALSDAVVRLIYGDDFAPAAPIMAILIFGALAITLHSAAAAILLAADRPGWVFALNAPLAPLAFMLQWLLVPRWGAVGAAGISTVLACAAVVVMLIAVRRTWGVGVPTPTWIRAGVLCVGAYAVCALVPTTGAALLLALVGVTVVIVVGYTVSEEITPPEWAFARSLLPRRWRRV